MDLPQIRKSVVALVGVAVIVAGQLGLTVAADVPDLVATAFDAVVGLLTAFGVFRVPNASA